MSWEVYDTVNNLIAKKSRDAGRKELPALEASLGIVPSQPVAVTAVQFNDVNDVIHMREKWQEVNAAALVGEDKAEWFMAQDSDFREYLRGLSPEDLAEELKLAFPEAQPEEDPKPTSSETVPNAEASAAAADTATNAEHAVDAWGLTDEHEALLPARITRAEGGVLVDETGEILNPETAFELLGIVQKRQDFRIETEEEARWFIGKIRTLQLQTSDRVLQLMGMLNREMRAYKTLMDWFGPQLRNFVEPQLPRNTKGANVGKLKSKNWKCIEGTVFFKATGGWRVEDKTRAKEFIDGQIIYFGVDGKELRLGDINALIPEPLREKYGVKLNVTFSSRKLYEQAAKGEMIPGVQETVKHELGIMGIGGGGDRSAWSLKRTIDGLKESMRAIESRLKGLAYGIDDDDEEEAA